MSRSDRKLELQETCLDVQVADKSSEQHSYNMLPRFFDFLLTVHLSIFILVFNQLDAQNLFYNKHMCSKYVEA